jgi:hypothetical protein
MLLAFAFWLSRFLAFWLSGFLAFWLSGFLVYHFHRHQNKYFGTRIMLTEKVFIYTI